MDTAGLGTPSTATNDTSGSPEQSSGGINTPTRSSGSGTAAGLARSSVTKPKRWVRVVAFVAVLFTGWHVLASFLWIAPYSQNAREILPGNVLERYMIPFFGQSWSVFAPSPIDADYNFNVRAVLANKDGTEEETVWVSATDIELTMLQYNLLPPRASMQAAEAALRYKSSVDGMSEVERQVIAGDFVEDKWDQKMRKALNTAQPEGSKEEQSNRADDFVKWERRITAYSTQVAKAMWGDRVVRVQYIISSQRVIPFAQRHDPEAQRPEPSILGTGWRAPVVEKGQNEGNFADVFLGQFKLINQ